MILEARHKMQSLLSLSTGIAGSYLFSLICVCYNAAAIFVRIFYTEEQSIGMLISNVHPPFGVSVKRIVP